MEMIIKGWNTEYSNEDTVILLKIGEYADGSTALAVHSLLGEPLCRPTICLAEYHETPSEGNVFIKDYSENEGVLKALQDAGVVGDVIRTVSYYSVCAHEVKLLVDVDT